MAQEHYKEHYDEGGRFPGRFPYWIEAEASLLPQKNDLRTGSVTTIGSGRNLIYLASEFSPIVLKTSASGYIRDEDVEQLPIFLERALSDSDQAELTITFNDSFTHLAPGEKQLAAVCWCANEARLELQRGRPVNFEYKIESQKVRTDISQFMSVALGNSSSLLNTLVSTLEDRLHSINTELSRAGRK